ncbi:hypothetical protein [Streptomyces roseochromogenus]|uniref:Large membrane protein n=1 Tax=Streptomyces roseochromogenus subsp. oscitans DS 12.976 TaxID=1352936 RepID=V6JU26_STRRC|nr:hypothetical protein [Streptomyces roseochromogenus]EST23337.1 hypothetical protein M878_33305 [Streptomyces roseochromogenus subsp. oscitans DS 12.976]
MNTEGPENREHPEGAEHAGSAASRESTADLPGGRRRSRLAVLSVAAAVLLVGGGGAYLAAGSGAGGRTDGPGTAGGGATPPPLALDGFGRGTGGIAPGEPDPYGATYVAAGELPAGPGSAPVYAPKGEVGKDAVARLAKALGVDGTPVAQGSVWRVGGQDGSGPSLQVNRDAPGSWTFSRYAPGTDDCKKGVLCTHDPMAPAGTPVSVAKATAAAASVLKAAGLDDAKIDASQVMGAQRVVNAEPVVGGLPTYGWTTGLTVDKQGELVGGHGLLGAPVKGDTYPVLSAAKTLKLMNAAPKDDHRMGIGGCTSGMPLKDRLEQPCTGSTGVPEQGADRVTVAKAVFGLAAHSVAGRQTLVPSWLFEVREPAGQGASTVTYPAVDPRYLASATTPSGGTSTAPKPHSVRVTGYTADDRELKVSFYGGVCADYKASAKESRDRVTVTVTERPWPDKVCVLIAKEYVKTVRLAAPLGGRTVVGDDGARIPQAKPGSLRPDASAQAR